MVVRLSGTQPQGPKHLETLENKTVDGTQNTVRVNRGVTANRPASPVVGEFYYNTDKQAFEQYTSAGWFNIAQAPSAPTSVVATDQGSGRSYNDGQASVAFTPNSSGGAPSSFIVTPSPATSPATFTTTTSPVTVTGLASSTQYTYTVSATGTYGTSAASAASAGVTATTVPQAPTIGSASGGDSSATLTFTAGATGGSSITNYKYSTDNSIYTAFSPAQTSSPLTISGLTNGTIYSFYLKSVNANGDSAASSISNSIIPSATNFFEIATINVTSSTNPVTLQFTNIPQNYKHLQLRASIRGGGWQMRFNNDSGNNYTRHYIYGQSSSTSAAANLNTSAINVMDLTAENLYFAPSVVEIFDYTSTNRAKVVFGKSGFNGSADSANEVYFSNGVWSGTDPITSITFFGGTAVEPGTKYSLYGITGA